MLTSSKAISANHELPEMAPKRQSAAATVANEYESPNGFSYAAAAKFFAVDKDELQVWVVGRMARHMGVWMENTTESILSQWPVAKAALENKYGTFGARLSRSS